MKIRGLVEMLLPIFLFLVLLQLANGLSTKTCNTIRLRDQLKNDVKCLETIKNKYVNEVLKIYNQQKAKKTTIVDLVKACKTHDNLWREVKTCANEFCTSCMDYNLTKVANGFLKSFDLSCDAQKLSGMRNISRNFEDEDLEELNEIIETIGRDPASYFKSLIKFDKTCSLREIETELLTPKGTIFRCVADGKWDLNGKWKDIVTYIQNHPNQSDRPFPEHVSPCKSVTSALKSCLDENDCVSREEMELIKYLASKVYQITMSTSLQITENFGGAAKVYNALRSTTLKYNSKQWLVGRDLLHFKSGIDELVARVLKTVDFFIEDFKNKSCKENLKGLPNSSPSPTAQLSSFTSIFFLTILHLKIFS